MNKKVIIVCAIIAIAAIFLFWGGRSPEKTTEQFLEAMHECDASKFVSLCCDELIENANVESKKVFIKQVETSLEADMQKLKDKYGDKYKYDIEIIDSYEYIPSEYSEYMSQFSDEDMVEVAFVVNYEGKGWLNEKEGEDSGEIQLIKRGRKWYIASFN